MMDSNTALIVAAMLASDGDMVEAFDKATDLHLMSSRLAWVDAIRNGRLGEINEEWGLESSSAEFQLRTLDIVSVGPAFSKQGVKLDKMSITYVVPESWRTTDKPEPTDTIWTEFAGSHWSIEFAVRRAETSIGRAAHLHWVTQPVPDDPQRKFRTLLWVDPAGPAQSNSRGQMSAPPAVQQPPSPTQVAAQATGPAPGPQMMRDALNQPPQVASPTLPQGESLVPEGDRLAALARIAALSEMSRNTLREWAKRVRQPSLKNASLTWDQFAGWEKQIASGESWEAEAAKVQARQYAEGAAANAKLQEQYANEEPF